MIKNRGVDLEKEKRDRSAEDWTFGAFSLPCLASIPEGERESYLPQGELQYGLEDFMDCASRAPVNILETKFNWLIKNSKISEDNIQWLIDKGYMDETGIRFSDRFVAINSGTTRQGNSLIAPLKAIHTYGMIPKSLLPKKETMTWAEYHNESDVTPHMMGLGKEFAERFHINYEIVDEIHYKELLKDDMLDLAAYAWPQPVNGEYPRTEAWPNHAFVVFKTPAYYVFDNYLDNGQSHDFIKKLASDYDFLEYGYRIFIASEGKPKRKNWFKDTFKRLVSFMLDLFRSIIRNIK